MLFQQQKKLLKMVEYRSIFELGGKIVLVMIKYLECIVESGLFDNISKDNYIDVLEQLAISSKKVTSGYSVYFEDDPIDCICIVKRGSIRGEKTYDDGEIHIVETYDENSILCLDAALSKRKTSYMDFRANENSTLVFVSLDSIRKSKYGREIMDALMEQMADSSIKRLKKIEILAEKGLRNRILIYFDILKKKSGSPVISVNMNREQMAQFLCVNRSALSNELNKMKREGLIDFDRDCFILKNI